MSSETFYFNTVHIIESLKESDGQTGRRLYDRLQDSKAKKVQFLFHTVFDKTELKQTLIEILAASRENGDIPILHIEAHGGPNGLTLRSGDISWQELYDPFVAINRFTRFNLIVVLACCCGIEYAHTIDPLKPCPFAALLAASGLQYGEEMLNGFIGFYCSILETQNGIHAVDELVSKIKKGSKDYVALSASYMFAIVWKRCRDLLRNHNFILEHLGDQIARVEILQREKGRRYSFTSEILDHILDVVEEPVQEKIRRGFFYGRGVANECRSL